MKLSARRSVRVFHANGYEYIFTARTPRVPVGKKAEKSGAKSGTDTDPLSFRLGGGGSRQSGDSAANLPGPFSAQQCHARCSWASFRENHGDASGPTRESSRA